MRMNRLGSMASHPARPSLRIIGVAMLTERNKLYWLPRPNRHGDVISLMTRAGQTVGAIAKSQQGFVSERALFFTRRQAMQIAKAAGQIRTTRVVDGVKRTHEPVSDELYSEDLW